MASKPDIGSVRVISEREPPGGWLACHREPGDFTLTFPLGQGNVLLGLKKRGFGQGRINGFGGKVEQGESIWQAAARELEEECGLRVRISDLVACGRITTVRMSEGEEPVFALLHVFRCSAWFGSPIESDEMRPAWFKYSEIPFCRMWPEASHFLPLLLESTAMPSSEQLLGRFDYSVDNHSLAGWRLEWRSN